MVRFLKSLLASDDSARPTRRPTTAFRPALQTLDGRIVPAVIGPVQVTNGTLLIQTDTANDQITLTDRGGTVAAGNRVDAVLNGELRSFVGVRAISVTDAGSTLTGRNTITYTATDTPVGSFTFQGGVAPAGRATNAGNDTVQMNLNGLAANRVMSVTLLGGDGGDTLGTRLAGRYQAWSQLHLNAQGGLGWDVVSANAWGTGAVSDPNSLWNVRLAGNTFNPAVADSADNNVAFHALGRMDGNILFDIQGGSRNDWVSANLYFNQGSQARVGDGRVENARVLGHGGRDSMDLIIRGSHTENLLRFNRLTVDGGAEQNHQLSTAAFTLPGLRAFGAFNVLNPDKYDLYNPVS